MEFKIGDKVSFLNEPGGGIVKRFLKKGLISIEIEDGFEIPVLYSNIVKVVIEVPEEKKNEIVKYKKMFLPTRGVSKLFLEKEESEGRNISKKHINYKEVALEVDLHIENLIERSRHLSNGEIITIQLNHFQARLEAAIRNNVHKVVFIHGVGNGVLKSEIRRILSSYSGLTFYDASYGRYGFGATEVNIR